MEIKAASAGTLESGDILVEIIPARQKGIEILLNSTVSYQFGDQIKEMISNTLSDLDITDVTVHATDKGALDCTIKARVTAAVCRAIGKDIWD